MHRTDWQPDYRGAQAGPGTRHATPCAVAQTHSTHTRGRPLRRTLTAMLVGQSFDHLVGALEQRNRKFMPNRLGGPEIDYEFEFGRLLDWNVGGLCATQDSGHHPCTLTVDFSEARSIANKAALLGHVRPLIDCW